MKRFLLWLIPGAALAVFIAWRVLHPRLRDWADLAASRRADPLLPPPDVVKADVYKAEYIARRDAHETRAQAITHAIEAAKKAEIIEAFEKAFGLQGER